MERLQLREALALLERETALFHDRVRAGEWEEAGRVEARRFELMQDLFKDPIPPADHAAAIESLQRIVAADGQLTEQLIRARHACGADLARLQQGRAAHTAYRAAAA